MKKIELNLRKLLRIVFGSLSLTAVAFIFQACYGMDRDDFYDVKLTGMVKSKTTNQPIQGIKVLVNAGGYNYGITDENGKFDFYASVPNYDMYYNDRTSRFKGIFDFKKDKEMANFHYCADWQSCRKSRNATL